MVVIDGHVTATAGARARAKVRGRAKVMIGVRLRGTLGSRLSVHYFWVVRLG